MKPMLPLLLCAAATSLLAPARPDDVVLRIDTPMSPPRWAELQRELLAENAAACREFYKRYFDERGYLKCVVRWGANDGPDDAPENFNRWPELHALGADDEILRMYLKGWEGHLKQYTEAKTTDVPIARQGMYYKEFIVQFDWMHNGEGLQLFNRMGLSVPTDARYRDRARRFAAFYMDEDTDAPNYDPKRKLIKSVMNGSRGPMLRKATALDWAGDPIDLTGFTALHGERNYKEFLAHYAEYTDVVGDHFLNLVATTLPLNAYLATGADVVCVTRVWNAATVILRETGAGRALLADDGAAGADGLSDALFGAGGDARHDISAYNRIVQAGQLDNWISRMVMA